MILLNLAGGSSSDPILRNLGIEAIAAASTMDIATVTDVWIDGNNTFPGTNSVKASLSPAATVTTSGTSGSYNDTTKAYTIVSTTGLAAGDWLYLNHAALTAGLYEIASVVNGTDVTITGNPLNGGGNRTGISYQVGWSYNGTGGTAPITSSSGGTQNYLKMRAADSAANSVDSSDSFYVRDALSGAAFVAIDGKTYDGTATTNQGSPSLDILPSWANRGGISHVALTTHSGQGVNNFTFGDDTTAEKTIAAALASDLKLSAGDGIKYGALLLRARAGGVAYSVDIQITRDSTAPTLTFKLAGR